MAKRRVRVPPLCPARSPVLWETVVGCLPASLDISSPPEEEVTFAGAGHVLDEICVSILYLQLLQPAAADDKYVVCLGELFSFQQEWKHSIFAFYRLETSHNWHGTTHYHRRKVSAVEITTN